MIGVSNFGRRGIVSQKVLKIEYSLPMPAFSKKGKLHGLDTIGIYILQCSRSLSALFVCDDSLSALPRTSRDPTTDPANMLISLHKEGDKPALRLFRIKLIRDFVGDRFASKTGILHSKELSFYVFVSD